MYTTTTFPSLVTVPSTGIPSAPSVVIYKPPFSPCPECRPRARSPARSAESLSQQNNSCGLDLPGGEYVSVLFGLATVHTLPTKSSAKSLSSSRIPYSTRAISSNFALGVKGDTKVRVHGMRYTALAKSTSPVEETLTAKGVAIHNMQAIEAERRREARER